MGKREYYRMFVGGEKADVYESKFEKVEAGKISWNWCAFLFSGCWLLYRRMYAWFFALLGVSVIIGMVSLKVNGFSMLSIVTMILMGLFGDKLYKAYADKHFPSCEDENMKDMKYREVANRYGGTSVKAVLIYFAVCLALGILSAFFTPTV